MAEINANIPVSAKPPEFDPLAVAARATQLGQGVLNNRLLGQQVQGKEALGSIIGQNTGADGKTNWDGVSAQASQDPRAALLLPEIQKSALDRQISQLGLDKAQLELTKQRWSTAGDYAMAQLAQKEPLTRESVIKGLGGLVATGIFSNEESVAQLTKFAQELPTDDRGLRKALEGLALRANMSLERVNMLMGAPSTVDTGSEILQQQVSPLTGNVSLNAVVPKERSPSEKAALVQVYDPVTKSMKLVPSGTLLGDDAPGTKGDSGAVGAAAPALGAAEATGQVAAASGKQFADLTAQADQAPQRIAGLQNIRDTVAKFQPGMKTNWLYAAKALATQLGVASPQVKDEVAAQEEFNKLATQFVNQQMGTLGGSGTDAKLESAAKGSPNEFMSKEGILGVTSLMLGLEDAMVAKQRAAQAWMKAGNGPDTYGEFSTQFNKVYNPRVFQSVYMTPGQRAAMMKNMSADQRKQFEADWMNAKKWGWIK